MDDTDRRLMLLLCENPRMHYREISKKVGISRQAIHHRVQSLTETGFFSRMKAIISAKYINAVPAAIWGRSCASSIDETLDRLGECEFVGRVVVAGGNYIYVLGVLRDTTELDGYIDFVRRTAEMPEPTLGMANMDDGVMPDWTSGWKRKESYEELSPLDMRIIASLMGNARRPASEVAKMVGVSAKTVSRHLEAMRSEGSLDFDEPWDNPPGEDMLTVVHVVLRHEADKVKVARRLISKDPVHASYFRSFVNLPSFLLGLISSDRMSEIRTILREIGEDEDVLSVTPNLVYFERLYSNWAERLTAGMTPAKRHPRSIPTGKVR
jgi:DNA-binding Lrp family transcriptional regulator